MLSGSVRFFLKKFRREFRHCGVNFKLISWKCGAVWHRGEEWYRTSTILVPGERHPGIFPLNVVFTSRLCSGTGDE